MNSLEQPLDAPVGFEAPLFKTWLTDEIGDNFVELLPACPHFFISGLKYSAGRL